eukprot:29006-Eustigmatos_ZCMA.PRE.1
MCPMELCGTGTSRLQSHSSSWRGLGKKGPENVVSHVEHRVSLQRGCISCYAREGAISGRHDCAA